MGKQRGIEKMCVFVVFLALGVAAPGAAQTAEREGDSRGTVGVFAAAVTGASDGLDGDVGIGVAGAFFFTKVVGVEGSFQHQTFDLEGSQRNALSGGTLSVNVITANLIVRPISGGVQPYASAGLALYRNEYQIDASTLFLGVPETVDNAVGFNVAGGVDFRLFRRLGVFAEGRYIVATADTLVGSPADLSLRAATDQQLNYVTLSGGMRVSF